ncbi:MAG: twin-arginine translocase subunit TatB [Halieaceae bacterium]|nr:twin-arginine translocase subunit TatB [Halieaceae bacterium]
MFDIGFAELLLVAVVGLLVIGPERLPEAIRTGSAWLHRIRRGFNDIKREVQQELHNDAVMQDLRKTGEQLQRQAETIGRGLDADAFTTPPPEQERGDQVAPVADDEPAPQDRRNEV